jgi:ATP-dependent Clp protease ATP-binding subunit ClpB
MTEANEDEVVENTRKEVFELLKKTIRPEFLNRVDEIIMFKPLSKTEIRDIVKLQFELVRKMLDKNGIHLEITEKAIDKLAATGYDPQFGARPLKRVMQRKVLNELSKMILAGKVEKDHKILIDVEGDEFVFKNI